MSDYPIMTVAELVSKLAGLPPMMEVFASVETVNDGGVGYLTDMNYINGITLDDSGKAPLLILNCNLKPNEPEPDVRGYEERLDEQRQKAMHMGSETERATKMHPKVE